MQIQSSDIETIVRTVLQRLRSESAAHSLRPIGKHKTSPNVSVDAPAGERLVFEQSLITMSDVESLGSGVSAVTVPPRAVVTPAVRDELRRRGISLNRTSQPLAIAPNTDRTTASPVHQGFVLVPQTKFNHTTSQLGKTCQVRLHSTVADELVKIETHLRAMPQARVLWCTAEPFAATCTVTGQSTPSQVLPLRCVMLHEFNDLSRAIAEASPNTLIVDDRRWTAAALVNLFRQWERLTR